MNTTPVSIRTHAPGLRLSLRSGLCSLLACVLVATAAAQSASTGKISGRVFNPVTQQYVRNAEVRVAGTDVVASRLSC